MIDAPPPDPRTAWSVVNAPPAPGTGLSERGRVATGSDLLTQCWEFLRARPGLLWLPGLSAAATTLAALVIFVPVLLWTEQQGVSGKIAVFIATSAAAFPCTFIAVYFNVGFLHLVMATERGERITARDALTAARGRLAAIFIWSLIATLVGVLVRGLQRLPNGDIPAAIVSLLIGVTWGLATYFAVPVIALHGTGPVETIRRSSRVFRKRWGEQVTGEFGIGVLTFVYALPGLIVAFAGAALIGNGYVVGGGIVLAAGVVLVVPVFVASEAISQLFQLALYRYSVDGTVTAPFTADQIVGSIKPKPRRSWFGKWFGRAG